MPSRVCGCVWGGGLFRICAPSFHKNLKYTQNRRGEDMCDTIKAQFLVAIRSRMLQLALKALMTESDKSK